MDSCINIGSQYAAIACIPGGTDPFFPSSVFLAAPGMSLLKSCYTLAISRRRCCHRYAGCSFSMSLHSLRGIGVVRGVKTTSSLSMQTDDASLSTSITAAIASGGSTYYAPTSSTNNRRHSTAEGILFIYHSIEENWMRWNSSESITVEVELHTRYVQAQKNLCALEKRQKVRACPCVLMVIRQPAPPRAQRANHQVSPETTLRMPTLLANFALMTAISLLPGTS